MPNLVIDIRTVLGNRETACWINSKLQVSGLFTNFKCPGCNWLPALVSSLHHVEGGYCRSICESSGPSEISSSEKGILFLTQLRKISLETSAGMYFLSLTKEFMYTLTIFTSTSLWLLLILHIFHIHLINTCVRGQRSRKNLRGQSMISFNSIHEEAGPERESCPMRNLGLAGVSSLARGSWAQEFPHSVLQSLICTILKLSLCWADLHSWLRILLETRHWKIYCQMENRSLTPFFLNFSWTNLSYHYT